MPTHLLKSQIIDNLLIQADELIDSEKFEELAIFLETHSKLEYTFEHLIDEANFYYMLGNCAQVLYNLNTLEWFSDKLSQSVIAFRKALYAIQKIDSPTQEDLFLKSRIENNLGNNLSNQGRCFCCISLWDNAIQCKQNPIPISNKAQNELYLANIVYDPGHQELHYFFAYQLIQLGLERLSYLDSRDRSLYSSDSEFMLFKTDFEENSNLEDFAYFEDYKMEFESQEHADYLKWCGDHRLFLNDLNDVSLAEIVYQDIITLPNISYRINPSLALYETLMYHGNFDEIKNDYCYARHLIFLAQNITDNQEKHLFNNTYPHINDMSHSITNLKAQHYKSGFRILYSLFDKIAYFLHRFLDLDDFKFDHKVSFDAIFRQKTKGNSSLPHEKLKNSQNPFIHALFYILKDIRDVQDSAPISYWLDPDAKKFTEIRNALEHRSLKIVDDFGFILTQSDAPSKQAEVAKLNEEQSNKLQAQIDKLSAEVPPIQNPSLREELQKDLKLIQSQRYEKRKLSTHSVLITESEFQSRLMTLIKLTRNSIMYLSLALHVEEDNRPDSDKLCLSIETPLKKT